MRKLPRPHLCIGRWVAAKDLKIGDKCLLSDGKNAIILNVKTEKLDEPFKTYNFEVADFHTYYVGEQGILVHNACGDPYIKSDTYRQMGKEIGHEGRQQFVDAMNKGHVRDFGQEGIKSLGAKINGKMYQYEVKVLSGIGKNYRLYGNFSDDVGTIVFDFFGKALH